MCSQEIDNSYVEIASFRDLIDAEIVRSRLESAGIDCTLENQHLASINWVWSNAIGGVKILVPQDKVEEALCLLQDEPTQDDDSNVEAGNGDCPNCGSLAVRKHSRLRIVGILSLIFFPLLLILGFPLLLKPTHWYCLRCGHKWQENT